MELSLWFQKNPSCELLQARFKHPQGGIKISYRGKSLAFQRDAGLFQWSAAVKALAVLAVGTRASVTGSQDSGLNFLEGEGGSLAATLDYAIAKPTSWIVDLFGREDSGKSYARLVFKRENSERKRPGPVRVSLSSRLHDPSNLRIFLDGVELLTTQELQQLLELLTQEQPTRQKKGGKAEHGHVFQASWFTELLKEEVLVSLRETEVLDRLGIEEACEQAVPAHSPSEPFVSDVQMQLLSHVLPPSGSTRRNGANLLSQGPCRVACPPTAAGALAIFNHVQSEAGDALSLNAAFPSTRSILDSGDFNSYSLAVLSWGAAKILYKREGFERLRPVMLLPRTSFGLVLRGELSSPKQVEKVLLATDDDSYTMRFLAIAKARHLLNDNCEPISATFSETMSLLPRKGDAAITAFPISHLLAKRHRAKVLWIHDEHFRCGDNILFARHSLDPSAVATLIREAWYTLLEQSSALDSSLERIFSAVDFSNYLYRLAALYQVRP